MTAKDLISPTASLLPQDSSIRTIGWNMPVADVLPRLLDAPGRVLNVVDTEGTLLGTIDSTSLLEGLGRMIAARDDSSTVIVECAAADYSASILAHAIEDADAHLVDLWTTPAPEGKVKVTLRVRHTDPTHAVRSLERYGFEVVDAFGAMYADDSVTQERLDALRTYLRV